MTVPDDVRPAPDTDSGGQISEGEAASSSGHEAAVSQDPADPPPEAPSAALPEAPSDNAAGLPSTATGLPDHTAELPGTTTELPEHTAELPGATMALPGTATAPPEAIAERPVDAGTQDLGAPAWQPVQAADGSMSDQEQIEAPPVAPVSRGWAEEADAAADAERGEEPATADPADPDTVPASALAEVQTALMSLGSKVDGLATTTAELARLRTRDTDLISRLHDDVTTLRSGEVAAALNPVVSGMIKLHDQMVSLGALTDPASPVGMLYTQLLQTMELTCGVRPFSPARGDPFDASRHTGTRRIPTTDASADGTIADTIKAGFIRDDGSVVRVAEVEVHRLSV
jgi:hypothetical protein